MSQSEDVDHPSVGASLASWNGFPMILWGSQECMRAPLKHEPPCPLCMTPVFPGSWVRILWAAGRILLCSWPVEPAAENLAARLLCFHVCRSRALVIVLGPLVAAAGLSLQTRLEPDGGGASCVLNAARRVAFSAA